MTFYIFHTAALYTYALFSLINGIIVPCHSRHERAATNIPQNFTLANLECQSKDESIFKWSKFNSTPAQLEVLSTLNSSNMKKPWIDGHISYSNLVYWLGCLPVAEYTLTTNIANNSIYTCSNLCLHQSDHIVDYIGMSVNGCYCLETINGQSAVNRRHCSEKCRKQEDDASVNENCGSHGYIGIYKLYKRDIQFDSVDISPGDQCVTVTMETGRYHYQLQHCKRSKNAFACKDQVGAKINKTGFHDMCEWINRRTTCILHNLTNWIMARNYCLSHNSRLVWDSGSSFEQNLFHSNTWYWTGIFRTSLLTESETGRVSMTADVKCRVLIAESATVTVQNCSDRSPYICYKHQHNTINPDRNGTPNSHIQPYVPVIIPGISIPSLFIAIAIIIWKLQKYRRSNGNNYRNTEIPNLTETEELATSTGVNVDNRPEDNDAVATNLTETEELSTSTSVNVDNRQEDNDAAATNLTETEELSASTSVNVDNRQDDNDAVATVFPGIYAQCAKILYLFK